MESDREILNEVNRKVVDIKKILDDIMSIPLTSDDEHALRVYSRAFDISTCCYNELTRLEEVSVFLGMRLRVWEESRNDVGKVKIIEQKLKNMEMEKELWIHGKEEYEKKQEQYEKKKKELEKENEQYEKEIQELKKNKEEYEKEKEALKLQTAEFEKGKENDEKTMEGDGQGEQGQQSEDEVLERTIYSEEHDSRRNELSFPDSTGGRYFRKDNDFDEDAETTLQLSYSPPDAKTPLCSTQMEDPTATCTPRAASAKKYRRSKSIGGHIRRLFGIDPNDSSEILRTL